MPNLTYRDITESDTPAIHAIASHWPVVRQLGSWPWPPQEAYTRSRCQPYNGQGFVWAVCLDGRVVGSMGVTKGEMGYAFAPDVHGKGIATKAARHAIDHVFAHSDLPMIAASVWHDNPASAAVLRKCGFVHWQTYFVRGRVRYPTEVHQYRLPRATWHRLSTTAQ